MDTIFKALADPARRKMLDSLRDHDGQTLSELQNQFEMTRFGVMKHLGVLENAGLIVTRRAGRFKHHYLNAVPLQQAIDRWIEPLLVKPAARAVLNLKSQLEGTAAMNAETNKPDFMMAAYIRCTQDALWQAISDPQQVVRWHFMARTAQGSLDEGAAATYFTGDGGEMLRIEVTRAIKGELMEMTFVPRWSDNLASSRCVYRIAAEGDHCKLTVEHYDIPPEQVGVLDGWHRLVSGLKTWLETGERLMLAG